MTTNQSRDTYSSLAKSQQFVVLNWHQEEHIKFLKVQLSKMESTAFHEVRGKKLGSFLLTPGGPGRACSPACACSTYHTYDTWTWGHCNSWMRLKIGTGPLSLGDQRAGITAKCRSYILEMVQGGISAVIDLSDVFCSFWFLLSPCHSGQKVLSNTLAFFVGAVDSEWWYPGWFFWWKLSMIQIWKRSQDSAKIENRKKVGNGEQHPSFTHLNAWSHTFRSQMNL